MSKIHRAEFIASLANELGWTLGVELGVWHGKTLARLLKTAPKLHMIGVDAWTHIPDEMEHYKAWGHRSNELQARRNTEPYADRVSFLKMTTDEASFQIDYDSLDFVFIDADHRYSAVVKDIQNWTPKVKSGGYLMGHDINWNEVKQAVDESLGYNNYKIGPSNVWYREQM